MVFLRGVEDLDGKVVLVLYDSRERPPAARDGAHALVTVRNIGGGLDQRLLEVGERALRSDTRQFGSQTSAAALHDVATPALAFAPEQVAAARRISLDGDCSAARMQALDEGHDLA